MILKRSTVHLYHSYESYQKARKQAAPPLRGRPNTGLLGRIDRMIGRRYMHHFSVKEITGYEATEEHVTIYTTLKPVYLPLKGLGTRLERDFLLVDR